MNAVYALYTDGDSAQRAVDALRATGMADREITVISAEPMEDYEFAGIDHRSRLWYLASAGGLLGFLVGVFLTSYTELAWPLPTGNMPIVAWWANLIVIFELTMLGGILTTVISLVVTGGLARRMPPLYDPEVTNGKILVGVEAPRDRDAVERALLDGGAPSVLTR